MTRPTPDRHLRLGGGREFDAIRDLVARWGSTAQGIGDDAAVVDIPRGDQLVVSVDAFIEGRHFEAGWIDARDVGYRATAAALSDLAAMAASPLAVLFAINLPDAWRDRIGVIADGVADGARAVGAKIVGGNIAAATELAITTTVLGRAFAPLGRGGARAGDRLYVTGRLGGPGAAVDAWKRGATPDAVSRERFARPVPRCREGLWLAGNGASSCIDISDGIIADAAHLAAASGLRLEIDIDRLPVLDGIAAADAARSGEEYELLVSAPDLDMTAFAASFGLQLTEIGRVLDGDAGVAAFDGGRRVAVIAGHDHLSP